MSKDLMRHRNLLVIAMLLPSRGMIVGRQECQRQSTSYIIEKAGRYVSLADEQFFPLSPLVEGCHFAV